MAGVQRGSAGSEQRAYTTFDALGRPHLGARMQWVRLFFLAAAIVPVAMLRHPRADRSDPPGCNGSFHADAAFRGGPRGRRFLARLFPGVVATLRCCGGHGGGGLSGESLLPQLASPGDGYLAGRALLRRRLLTLWWLSGLPELAGERRRHAGRKHVHRRRSGQTADPYHQQIRHGCRRNGAEGAAARRNSGQARRSQTLGHAHARSRDRQPCCGPTIDPWRLQFPISGTFIFVGVFLHIGGWIRFTRPDRQIVVLNTNSVEEFRRMIRRISPRTM